MNPERLMALYAVAGIVLWVVDVLTDTLLALWARWRHRRREDTP